MLYSIIRGRYKQKSRYFYYQTDLPSEAMMVMQEFSDQGYEMIQNAVICDRDLDIEEELERIEPGCPREDELLKIYFDKQLDRYKDSP